MSHYVSYRKVAAEITTAEIWNILQIKMSRVFFLDLGEATIYNPHQGWSLKVQYKFTKHLLTMKRQLVFSSYLKEKHFGNVLKV